MPKVMVPDPSRSTVVRATSSVSGTTPIFPYTGTSSPAILPNPPYVNVVVAYRGTSTTSTKPVPTKIKALSWIPIFVQPSRQIVYASTVGLELAQPLVASVQFAYGEFNVGYFNTMLFNG